MLFRSPAAKDAGRNGFGIVGMAYGSTGIFGGGLGAGLSTSKVPMDDADVINLSLSGTRPSSTSFLVNSRLLLG